MPSPSSPGTGATTSALWPPFPHLHGNRRSSQVSAFGVYYPSCIRVQQVDLVREKLALAQVSTSGGRPGALELPSLQPAAAWPSPLARGGAATRLLPYL